MNELDKALESRREWMEKAVAARGEITRLKEQHEEMLLKHAREQGIALEALEVALKEIARLKTLLGHE